MLCWGALCKTRRLITRITAIKLTRLLHELYSLARTKNYNLPKRLLKNIDLILTKTIIEAKKFYRLTETLAEKMRLLLLPKPLPRKDKPILETLQSQPRTKPEPRNKTNQNLRWPKPKPKILKPILATRQNRPELMQIKKTLPTKKPRTWKLACWKDIDPYCWLEKCHR